VRRTRRVATAARRARPRAASATRPCSPALARGARGLRWPVTVCAPLQHMMHIHVSRRCHTPGVDHVLAEHDPSGAALTARRSRPGSLGSPAAAHAGRGIRACAAAAQALHAAPCQCLRVTRPACQQRRSLLGLRRLLSSNPGPRPVILAPHPVTGRPPPARSRAGRSAPIPAAPLNSIVSDSLKISDPPAGPGASD
jgi:hypothetical protein